MVQPALLIQDERAYPKAQLREHGERNDRAQTDRLPGNRKVQELPRQRHACKSVEEHRMRNRRRILAVDCLFEEVQRGYRDYSINTCDIEYPVRISHFRLRE